MSTTTIRKIVLGALLLLVQGSLLAQQIGLNYNLVNGDTIEVQLCRTGDNVVFSGPRFGSTHAPFDGWAVVRGNGVAVVAVNNEMSAMPGGRYITVRNEAGMIDSSTTSEQADFYDILTPIIIHVHVDEDRIISGDSFIDIFLLSDSCLSSIWGIETHNMVGDSVLLTFSCTNDSVLVNPGDGNQTPILLDRWPAEVVLHDVDCYYDNTVTLSTVVDSGNHCCWYSHSFRNITCLPAYGCFDATALTASYTSCLYGQFYEPEHYGIVNGRHTLMYDTTQYDATLGGNLLRTVCPGCDYTIRLGNSSVGAEWEAVNYAVTVDTTISAILILKYAAVLENPNHNATAQPRFSFDLLDLDMQPVNNPCAHAEFVSNANMGWNSLDNQNIVMWKDWTTIGFDLSAYHGQTLNLRLKTSDCTQGAHFGYAYYTTRCASRTITALECGVTDSNTFSAPEGFNYEWFNSAWNLVSTSRSITVPSNGGVYRCRVSSIEDPSCNFELGTYAGVRLPKAAGSVEYIHPEHCRLYEVGFKNESFISSDGIHPVPYGGMCDEVIWHFGDGDSAIGVNPTHIYTDTGTYDVTIIAILGGGQCTDTAHLTVRMPTFFDYDEMLAACDSLRWRDSVLYIADTHDVTYLSVSPSGCDTLFTLKLNIHHSSYGNMHYDSICHHQPYLWNDTLLTMPPDSTHLLLLDTLSSRFGCDSSVIVHLTSWPDYVADLERDTVCYGQSYTWGNLTINDTNQPQTLLCIALRDTMATTHGCDSIVGLDLCRWPKMDFGITALPNCSGSYYTLSVDHLHNDLHLFMYEGNGTQRALAQDDTLTITADSLTAFHFIAGYTDSLFCQADTTLMMLPFSVPTAALKLTPQLLTYENITLHAYDITEGAHSRRWCIVHADGDSLALPDTAAHLVYAADVGDDSTRVVLAVSDGVCTDTAKGCIYLVRADFFAPNVFTPGQADNNRFVITGTSMRQLSLSIFNRQGLLVYTTEHPEEGWDGTHEGEPCMQGAYVWHLTYTTDITPERTQSAIGTITLLR
ncbi:MAG: gliding motility-associated C-terminal domain-containing protein [Bacteroidales bacterium]|nr:gliding motility-associated C-terminal domain-containing protein [Bacteroidales bacterium]